MSDDSQDENENETGQSPDSLETGAEESTNPNDIDVDDLAADVAAGVEDASDREIER